MSRHLLIAVIAVFALPAGAAHAADRCPHRHGERTLARSAEAVVTLTAPRTVLEKDGPTPLAQRLVGCSRRSGARRLIDLLDRRPTSGDVLRSARLAGTHVIYHWQRSNAGTMSDELTADDAIHRGRRQTLTRLAAWPVADPANERISSYAIASDGTATWIVKGPIGDDLRLWRPGAGLRRVDHGFALGGPLKLAGGMVHWSHGGGARSAPTTLPLDLCQGLGGTDQLGVVIQRRVPYVSKTHGTIVQDHLSICARTAEGSSGFGCGCEISSYDVAGSYAVVAAGSMVTRLDAAGRSAQSWDVEGNPLVAIDDAGSMVWADRLPDAPLRTRIWVLDRHGLREAATIDGHVTGLARDGRTVIANPGRLTIVLDP